MKWEKTSFKNKFKFKKKYGQNFIFDQTLIESIIEKANLAKNDTVIEIGAGIGSLTYGLAKKVKKVITYEIDEELREILNDNLIEFSNVDIKIADFLKEDFSSLKKEVSIVANIPYSITTPILFKIIDEQMPVKKIIIMVQKEVGERIAAKPNSKAYNAISVLLNHQYQIKKLMDIGKNNFYPIPNVESIVIEMLKKETNFNSNFKKLVKDSFRQKRKTIKNNLKQYNLEKIEKVLLKNNYSLNSRAEQIPIAVFVELSEELGE